MFALQKLRDYRPEIRESSIPSFYERGLVMSCGMHLFSSAGVALRIASHFHTTSQRRTSLCENIGPSEALLSCPFYSICYYGMYLSDLGYIFSLFSQYTNLGL